MTANLVTLPVVRVERHQPITLQLRPKIAERLRELASASNLNEVQFAEFLLSEAVERWVFDLVKQ